MPVVALSELLGSPVYSSTGSRCGRVREVAIVPQDDRSRIASLVVKTRDGNRLVNADAIVAADAYGLHSALGPEKWQPSNGNEGMLLLERDLLDQQIIDVHGRKVVRVNDADIVQERASAHAVLRIASVDVGPRGALRRLLKGLMPAALLRRVVERVPAKNIPWD